MKWAIKNLKDNTYYSEIIGHHGYTAFTFKELSKDIIIKNSLKETLELFFNMFRYNILYHILHDGYIPVILTESKLEELSFLKLKNY